MSVLITHEYSGTIRNALRAVGVDAWSVDLLPAEDASPYHIQGNCFDVMSDVQWTGGLSHPDCTYLTVAGIHWNNRGRGWEKTNAALDHVRRIMAAWGDRPYALKNPVSIISTHIRKPNQIIQPYEYGEDASKKTCLWLHRLPHLKPTSFFPPRLVCTPCKTTFTYGQHKCPACGSHEYKPRWGNQTDSGQNKLGPSDDRWKERARTYPGIAQAVANQWAQYLTAGAK